MAPEVIRPDTLHAWSGRSSLVLNTRRQCAEAQRLSHFRDRVVHDLRVGDARVTLRCWRTGAGKSRFKVLKKTRTLHVVRQPPPEAEAGFLQRAQALAETAVRAVS